jgi:hypothetical protein
VSIGLVALLAVTVASRFWNLAADPPCWIEESFLFDGGWWASGARNALLRGDPLAEDFGVAFAATPLYSRALELSFREFGMATESQRALSAASTSAAIVLAAFVVWRHASAGLALLVTALLALSPFYFAQGRIEIPDTMQGPFVLASFLFFLAGGRPAPAGIACGIAMGAAVAVKPTAIGTGGLALLLGSACWLAADWMAHRRVPRDAIVRILAVGVGLALAAATIVALHLVPYWHVISGAAGLTAETYPFEARHVLTAPGLSLISTAPFVDRWWPTTWRIETFSPVIFLGGWMYGLAALRRAGDWRSFLAGMSHLERMTVCWALGWCAAIVIAPSQYEYRYVAAVPLFAILAAVQLQRQATRDVEGAYAPFAGWPRRLLVAGWIALPVLLPLKAWSGVLAMWAAAELPLGEEPGLTVAPAGTVAMLPCAALVLLLARFPAALERLAALALQRRAAWILAAALAYESVVLGGYLASVTDSLATAQARLAEMLPARATVAAPLTSDLLLSADVEMVRRLEPSSTALDPGDPAWEAAPPAFVLLPVHMNGMPWTRGERAARLLAGRGYRRAASFEVAPGREGPRFVLWLLERGAAPAS